MEGLRNAHINDLPGDILQNIFKRGSQSARQQLYPRVCKLWHCHSRDAEWNSYALNLDEIPPPGSLSLPRVAAWFKGHASRLQELSIKPDDDIEDTELGYFWKRLELVNTVFSVLAPLSDAAPELRQSAEPLQTVPGFELEHGLEKLSLRPLLKEACRHTAQDVVYREQLPQPVVTGAATQDSYQLRPLPQSQKHNFGGIEILTLDCLCCELPPQIGKMTALVYLSVTFHTFMYTPVTYPPLSELRNLAELSITCYSDDCMEPAGSLPTDLDSLSNLQAFSACIYEETICQLNFGTRLTELHLDYQSPPLCGWFNRAFEDVINRTLQPLSNLCYLELHDCLCAVPDAIMHMSALKHLDLTSNNLTEVPGWLLRMHLTCLQLDNDAV